MVERLVARILVPLLVGCLLVPGRAAAWGPEGHVTVAKIAELNLSPKARKGVLKLLGPGAISDRKVANYADFVRHNPNFPEYSQSGPWHFVDIPVGEAFDPATH